MEQYADTAEEIVAFCGPSGEGMRCGWLDGSADCRLGSGIRILAGKCRDSATCHAACGPIIAPCKRSFASRGAGCPVGDLWDPLAAHYKLGGPEAIPRSVRRLVLERLRRPGSGISLGKDSNLGGATLESDDLILKVGSVRGLRTRVDFGRCRASGD